MLNPRDIVEARATRDYDRHGSLLRWQEDGHDANRR